MKLKVLKIMWKHCHCKLWILLFLSNRNMQIWNLQMLKVHELTSSELVSSHQRNPQTNPTNLNHDFPCWQEKFSVSIDRIANVTFIRSTEESYKMPKKWFRFEYEKLKWNPELVSSKFQIPTMKVFHLQNKWSRKEEDLENISEDNFMTLAHLRWNARREFDMSERILKENLYTYHYQYLLPRWFSRLFSCDHPCSIHSLLTAL